MKRDKLHFTFRKIDSYNKAFNAVISEREAGKSTALWLEKAYKAFKQGKTCIVLRRLIADITEVYINDIGEVINKFVDEPVKLTFKSGNIKEGIVDVYIGDQLFIRVIALSNPMSRIKSLIVRNLKYIIFDEFICNTKLGEKYLPNEDFKFKELYNTFQRENPGLKCYFVGNPYSVYTPYFVWWGVDLSKVKPGCMLTGKTWALQAYVIKPQLKELILKRNPLYEFDDSYTKYAFGGIAVNDQNFVIVAKQPDYYKLQFILKIENTFIGVYRNTSDKAWHDKQVFWCTKVDGVIGRRNAICFDLNDLIENTQMLTKLDKNRYDAFKLCIGNRFVTFSDLEVAYKITSIYTQL